MDIIKKVLLGSMIALTACDGGYWDHLPIHVATSERFEDEEIVFKLYNSAFGTEVFVADPDGFPVEVIDGLVQDPVTGRLGLGKTTIDCNGGDCTGSIQMSNIDYPRYLFVFAHELGHLLGLGHSDDEENIMHSPTNDDIDLVIQLQNEEFVAGVCGLYADLLPADACAGEE